MTLEDAVQVALQGTASAVPANTARLLLQGGPGTSMMRPVFLENGPYRLSAKPAKLGRRQGAWTQRHNMLYFDNPVGTGYSFTGSPDGMSKTVGEVCSACQCRAAANLASESLCPSRERVCCQLNAWFGWHVDKH